MAEQFKCILRGEEPRICAADVPDISEMVAAMIRIYNDL
jgi:hypothetical protein